MPVKQSALLTGLLLVVALVAGCGGAPPAPGTPSASSQLGAAVPVYYGARTGVGLRLYREFHRAAADSPGSDLDRATSAVRHALASDSAVDPDYHSLWPAGWVPRAPVRHENAVITVDLAAPPSGAGADEMTADSAALAVQQVVYTVQGALGSTDPVRILVDGKPVQQLFSLVPATDPIARADPSKVRSPVQIDDPAYGAAVGRDVRVRGEAHVWEGNLLWRVVRGAGPTGEVVQKGHATTSSGMAFAPFSFTVTLAPGQYTLVAEEPTESDAPARPPFIDTKTITVR